MHPRSRLRAVVTAGGTVDGPFAAALGTPVKALAPFGAGTLLDVALAACADAGIDGVAVVGGPEVRAHLAGRDVRVIDAAEDGGANVLRALAAWPGERFVYLTSDLPFANGASLADLVRRSAGYALAMGLANDAAYVARFPGAPEHGVALGRERVVNACAFVIRPEAADPIRDFALRAFAARKSLVALARLLGPGLALRFALRQLRVEHVEAYAGRELGLPVGAVRGCDPGLCYDVDTLAEYEYACAPR